VTVSRLAHIPGIGVNVMGDRADAAADPTMSSRPPTSDGGMTEGCCG